LAHKILLPEAATCMAVSPDDRLVAVGTASGKLCLWQLASGLFLRAVPGAHYRAVSCVQFTDDGSHVVTGGDDAAVHVWRVRDLLLKSAEGAAAHAVHTWAEHTLPVTAVYVGSGGGWARVFTASQDRTIKIWELATGVLLHTLVLPSDVTCLAVDLAEQVLFAGCGDSKIYRVLLQPAGVTSLPGLLDSSRAGDHTLAAHEGEILALALAVDGSCLVSAAKDGTLKVRAVVVYDFGLRFGVLCYLFIYSFFLFRAFFLLFS
jgi:pre-rRNA-processing protein IPI3